MTDYLVQSYLDNLREASPDKTAVCCGPDRLTYEELYTLSNKLANCLTSNGVARQDRVCFCIQRSINCLCAVAGILKADAIYVPIEAKSPARRVKKIIHDCRPSALICDGSSLGTVLEAISDWTAAPKIIVVESRADVSAFSEKALICKEEICDQDGDRPDYKNVDTDIAYILYTSGSTGSPKGVMISHSNIANYVNWAVNCFGISNEDNILSTAPFHFDMSTFDIYCALKTGATLCIALERDLLFPNRLMSLIEEKEVTIWKGVCSLLTYLAKTGSLRKERMKTLRKVLFGGEPLPAKHVINWMKIYPEKTFYNVYGPTEATGISAYHLIREIPKNPKTLIPIGKACENTEILLLKEDGLPAKIGESGELCVRGSGVSNGYWNDQAKTERDFVMNPLSGIPGDRIYRTGDIARQREDGLYEFIGRKDYQIKFRGYRIDPGEVENAILSISRVNDAAVISLDSSNMDMPELVAFVETKDGITPSDILHELRKDLAPYMVPQHIQCVKRIPRNDRGKIDRGALKELYPAERRQGGGSP